MKRPRPDYRTDARFPVGQTAIEPPRATQIRMASVILRFARDDDDARFLISMLLKPNRRYG